MPKAQSTGTPRPSRSKGFNIYYAVCAILVALTSGVAIFATVAPASAATLTGGVDTQLAVFLVPLALLMIAIIAEVLRITLHGAAPEPQPAPRRILTWTPGRREG